MHRRAATTLMFVALVTPLWAQRGRVSAGSVSRSSTSFGGRANQHSFSRAVYLGSPFWADDSPLAYSQAPSVIVIQPQPAAASSPVAPREEVKPASPLMIEWQGDRYVRRTEVNGSSRSNQPDYIAETGSQLTEKHSTSITPHPTEPPPATFVFRDGHREESSDYSIISGVIYASGDYWTNGYWAKQIALSQLDLPATFKANQDRGVIFRLPAASNEVVTRP